MKCLSNPLPARKAYKTWAGGHGSVTFPPYALGPHGIRAHTLTARMPENDDARKPQPRRRDPRSRIVE
jgi:hypothetical protein